MSSILTNTGAMVALQTMRGINKNLAQTQAEISTGKSIGNSRDNAAVWAISKTMESDVNGFKAISDSLALGSSTIAVGRQAAETVTELLVEMKGLVASAQEQNVDRGKIQTDITKLKEQITSVVGAAQFNGLNTVNGTQESPVAIMSSLDRSAGGVVQSGKIEVDLNNTNLTTSGGTEVAAAALPGTGAETAIATGTPAVLSVADFAFFTPNNTNDGNDTDGAVARRAGDLPVAPGTTDTALLAGDRVQLDINGTKVAYTIREGDGGAAILAGLRGRLESAGLSSSFTIEFDGDELSITNNTGSAGTAEDPDPTFALTATRGQGGLAALETLNVTESDAARADALNDIESMIQYAIDASANFGSAQKRVEIQAEFVSNLSNAMTTGIGSLVDADMEAVSARLQALQVQQQLATQSLSIANQQPQNILALFR